MSAFMLRKMVELIAQGVKTNKGFKEVHLNQVAKNLTDHYGLDTSGTQVYNHLREWRSRWVRIARLKDLSGALWDDQNNMIVLEDEHYMGHTKDKSKDVEFLNVPLENYTPMAIIFGGTQATGRFAMGSNEALGGPADMADGGLGVMEGGNGVGAGYASVAGASAVGPVSGNFIGLTSSGKRKRTPVVTEEEGAFLTNMTGAICMRWLLPYALQPILRCTLNSTMQ
uniref:Myb/SANT-like domain-containing protein n=1 Tax=Oryza barthii TaxID=65489 RepID=A0A0D3HS06_9ORYZ